tara:strand:+ start:190 stop:1404 length:1215 start_codon:yes stop_codon:yes gene_type:complete
VGLFSKLARAERQAQGEVPAPAPRPTLIQGGPAFFTPEGYVPPVQPEQAFLPTDVMRDPIADMFAAQPPLNRVPGPPKMIDPPKPPDQIFIDDMPPMREEPPMIVEEPPVIDEPIITMEDIDRIRRERGGPRRGDMMPPILDRNMIDYGYGPGIMPPLPDDFFIEESRPKFEPIVPDIIPPQPPSIQERPLGSFENPLFTQTGIGLTGTPVKERSERLLRQIEIPRRDEMSIDRSLPLPGKDIMPIRLPEPMPMLPKPMPMLPKPMPMPMRPRMPMPGPIATPMPMSPINLPKIELPKIERSEPMMPRSRGIESLYSPRMMMAEGGEVVEPLGEFSEDLPLTNYIFSLQSPERSELVNNLIGVTGITVGSAESIPMFVKRLIQTGSLKKPEVKEVIQESLEKNT